MKRMGTWLGVMVLALGAVGAQGAVIWQDDLNLPNGTKGWLWDGYAGKVFTWGGVGIGDFHDYAKAYWCGKQVGLVAANMQYTLTADMGVEIVAQPDLYGTVRFSLKASPGGVQEGTVLAEYSIDITGVNVPREMRTLTYTTNASDYVGQNLYVVVSGSAPNAGWNDGAPAGRGTYDNFVLDATQVPEPATMGLLALGGVGMLLRKRK